jgi:tRNA(Ile)-lysidine synthase
MLNQTVEFCKNKKNLLAFSAGVDSTALFFLLLDKNIDFDIAIVDYNLRQQSKQEVKYATFLAKKYNKKIYIKEYDLDKFSEKSARDFRYRFFEYLIQEYHYNTLLTAHQLNDKFEWFLMQFSKGAGLVELLGINELEYKNNYTLIRPLLNSTKDELIKYLEQNSIKYFIDESNKDIKYKRNDIRKNYSDKFVLSYKDAIKKSFEYLQDDCNSLMQNSKKIYEYKQLVIYKYNGDENIAIRLIDKELKQRGVLISSKTRDEILQQKQITISHKIAISLTPNKIYIAPICNKVMPKDFKNRCRVLSIPQNIRAYLYENNINIDEIVKEN